MASIGILFTISVLLYAGSPSDRGWWSAISVFALWAVAPYGIVLVLSFTWISRAAQILLGVAAAAALLPVPFLAYDAFIAHHGALDGLVFPSRQCHTY
jgi:hypothetical protein